MPRSKSQPRASEVAWLSDEEKQFALAQVPEDESLSDFVRRKAFKLPALPSAGRPKTENKMSNEEKAAALEAQAVVNDRYAQAAEETFAKTGRGSAASAAAANANAAAQKRAAAARLRNEKA